MPGKLFTDDLAKAIKESGKKHYRPSNGTEGMMFMERWCEQCGKCIETEYGMDCKIITNSMLFDADESGYPPEWAYDEGQPCCTAFEAKK